MIVSLSTKDALINDMCRALRHETGESVVRFQPGCFEGFDPEKDKRVTFVGHGHTEVYSEEDMLSSDRFLEKLKEFNFPFQSVLNREIV